MGEFRCKDCQRRTVGCHGTCEDYLEDKARWQEKQRKIRGVKKAEEDADSAAFTLTKNFG